jgi:hypothetical protein
MNIKKIVVLTFILATSHYSLVTPSFAQQVSLSLDPPIVQAKIKPGKSIIVAFTVHNSGDPTNLQFLIRSFVPQGQLGSLTVSPEIEGPVQFNLENADLQLEKPFFFASKEKKQAVIRIKVPIGIPDGDYYYIVLAETVPAFSVAGQSTGIASASIGAPILISITDSGITEIKATVGEFSFIPDYVFTIGNNTVRIVDSAKELPITCSVRNMGKNLIQPQGVIIDTVGTMKKSYSIIPQNILSNSQRIIKVYGDEGSVSVNSSVTLPHMTVGKHRVGLELSFGEGTPTQYKDLSFYALPIRFILVTLILLVALVIVFVIRFVLKRK